MTGNRYFAEAMQAYGVSHLFFVPTMMLPAMAEMESMGITRVVTHGEKAAAYMADGYARASRRPGICLAQNIGSTNLAAGLRDAYMACSPVIALTGGSTPGMRYRHMYQEVEDFAAWDGVTKANLRVDSVQRFPDMLRQAFRVATSGAPGPVHLDIRGSHAQTLEEEAELEPLFEERFSQYPAFRPAPEPAAVTAALAALGQAQRPIIVAGGGVVGSSAGPEVRQLAEVLSIPVATSLNAKDILPDDHPLNVGVPGTYSRWSANKAISEADLIFFIGSHTGSQVTTNWQVPAPGVSVIQLDIDENELGLNYPNKVSIHGDAKVSLEKMLAEAKSTGDRSAWVGRVQSIVDEYWEESEPMRSSDAVPIRPERICKEISDWLPDGGVVVADTGHSGMWTGQMLRLTQPNQRYIRCAGSLGWAFSGSIGVKAALPNQPVVTFCGDGGFYYHIGELETAARYGINPIVVVNNNFALNQEQTLFNSAYGGKQEPGSGWGMWHFQQEANLAKAAEALGCLGIRVDRPDDIRPALEQALAANRPAVVEVISDVEAQAKRAWTPTPAGGH
jgi:acetolactate synthase-1/2/3 large subunit